LAAFDVARNSVSASGWLGYIISLPGPFIKKEKMYSFIEKYLVSHICCNARLEFFMSIFEEV
jgi:hypothetical protein